MRTLRLAFGFLTILPVHPPTPNSGEMGRAGLWFPLVGLTLGGLLVAAQVLLENTFPPPLATVLVLVLWTALTGALHLDGWADCCDGLWVMTTPARRLEIMRDPRIGAFGVVGLVLLLLLKAVSIGTLQGAASVPAWANVQLPERLFALLFAPVLGRWVALWVARQPAARTSGLGRDFASGLSPTVLLGAIWLPLVLIGLGGLRALVAVAVALLVTGLFVRFARARIEGVNGDVMGASVELTELCVLLVYAARLPL